MVEFADSSLWSQVNDDPPTHPSGCLANNTAGNVRTDIPPPSATRPAAIVLQWEDAAPSLPQRDADLSFRIAAGDLGGFNHLFLGVGEEALGNGSPEQNGGRVGIAVYGNRMFVQMDVKQTPGDPASTVTCSPPLIPEPIDCNGNLCPSAGFPVPGSAIIGDRWYRARARSLRRDSGNLVVSIELSDLVTGSREIGLFSFPVACVPPWWNTSSDRFTFGVQGNAGPIGEHVDVRVDDFVGRPVP
jgi:hypothetical protein